MLVAVVIIASLLLVAWLIIQTVKQRPIKPSTVCYILAYITGVFTLAFFLSMELPQIFKILVSICLGAVLLIIAAFSQRRRLEGKQ